MKELEERLERIEKKLEQLLAMSRGGSGDGARTPPSSNGRSGEIASDSDLDGPRGDPEVRFVPRRWTGGDNKGKRYSECEPEFLDMLAEALEWFAQRDDDQGAVDKNGNPRGRWSRLDASRARGWAQRKRHESGAGSSAPVGGSSSGMNARGGAPRNGAGYGTSNGTSNGNGRAPMRGTHRMDDDHGSSHGSDEDIPF